MALVEDITERKKTEKALRELSGGLLRAEDRERRRIGRELHDSIGQDLAGLIMKLGALKEAQSSAPPWQHAAVRSSLEMARQALVELRTISYLLHPPALDDFGLLVALRSYVRGFAARSGIKTTVQLPRRLARLPIDMETALFRIVQESLNNVRQHSGSRSARITLRVAKRTVILQIRDFGRGFSNGNARGKARKPELGVGIAGMRERLQQFGGELSLLSTRKGTLVTAKLPVH